MSTIPPASLSPNNDIASSVLFCKLRKQTIFPYRLIEFKIRLVREYACIKPCILRFLSTHNVFNVDVLKPLYEDYHSKGFDIYQVSLDVDKSLWATTLKGQKLPWVNVCDSKGASSPYALIYNIQGLPSAFVIADGELIDGGFVDEASFRKLLDKSMRRRDQIGLIFASSNKFTRDKFRFFGQKLFCA